MLFQIFALVFGLSILLGLACVYHKLKNLLWRHCMQRRIARLLEGRRLDDAPFRHEHQEKMQFFIIDQRTGEIAGHAFGELQAILRSAQLWYDERQASQGVSTKDNQHNPQ